MKSLSKNFKDLFLSIKVQHIRIALLGLLVLTLPAGLVAGEANSFVFDPDYSLRLNDREAGFYYHERVVPSTEGLLLEISFELHDNKTMGRYGCEQTNRLVAQDLLAAGVMGEGGFDDILVDEVTFYEHYKLAFLRYVNNVRPYADLREFVSESLRIWYEQHCFMRNRLESNPGWFLDLPAERLVLDDSGMPLRTSFVQEIPGISVKSLKEVNYTEDQVTFRISSEGYEDIKVSAAVSAPVFDQFQINMVVASLDYHEGFEQSIRFKQLFVDVPLYEEWPDEGPETESYGVDALIKLAGSVFLPLDGEERPVWAVDVTGFEVSYHPLFHLYDHNHRRFDTIRYYICREKGEILMMETLTTDGRPVSIYHAD